MLHYFRFLEEKAIAGKSAKNKTDRDTDNWIISKAQNRFHSDE
jgi:hypothetical protein